MSFSALKDISKIIKMKNGLRKKDDDMSSLGFETSAGGACAVPG